MASITSDTNVVLITGANQGIGYEIAKLLTTKHKNYHVLLGSRSLANGETAASELQKLGLSVEPIQIDVTDDASILAAAEIVKNKYGRLDVLINNAGINRGENLSDINSVRQAYTECFDTNVFGHAVVTEAFAPLLDSSKSPRVVFMASTTGSLSAYADHERTKYVNAVYRSSKAALNMICLHYADQKPGWKVNANCPGHVATNLNAFGGKGSVAEGAINAVRLVVEGDETGTFTNKEGVVPW